MTTRCVASYYRFAKKAARCLLLATALIMLCVVASSWWRTKTRTEGVRGGTHNLAITVESRNGLVWFEWFRPQGDPELAKMATRRIGVHLYRQAGGVGTFIKIGGDSTHGVTQVADTLESRLESGWYGDIPEPRSGFATYSVAAPDTGVVLRVVCLPLWAITACLSFVAGAQAWRLGRDLRRSLRPLRGLCAFCGYDLRASPGACPECGRRRSGLGSALV